MGKRITVLLFIVLAMVTSTYTDVHAQYKRIFYESGVQPFAKNNVAVSYTGFKPTFPATYSCGVGPYHIGYFVSLLFIVFRTPDAYTFTFSNPIKHIRIESVGLYNTDFITVSINGVPYTLTNAHLYPLTSYNSCGSRNSVNATIVGGMMTGTLPATYSGATSAGTLIIKESGISSVTIAWSGLLYPNGQSGTVASVYFGQIDATNNGPLCAGDSLQLWGDTTITEPGTFHWQGPNSFTAHEQNPVIYPFTQKDTGIYTLTYVTGVDTFTDTTRVTILPGPSIPAISADSPVCAGTPLQLSALATAGATYSWSGPNGFSAAGVSVTIPNMQKAHEGIYTVIASLEDCHPRSVKEIVVTQPVLHSFTEVVCSNAGYDFNGQYLNKSGVYTDIFKGNNGCDSTSRLNLVVLPGPEVMASFPDTDGQLCMGDTVMLYAGGNAARYTWYNSRYSNLGEGGQLPFVLQHTANRVWLTGISDNDCIDTFIVYIAAEGCCQLYMPNAFSPNNDGINDVFVPVTNGHFNQYRMDIFNRWGQRIFSTNNITGWDGHYNNKPADIGTYYYYVVADCLAGEKLVKKGELVLVR